MIKNKTNKSHSLSAREFAKFLIYYNYVIFSSHAIVSPDKTKPIYYGNLMLNKFLQIANMFYIAEKGHNLFKEKFVCFLNGGVILEIWKEWEKLLKEVEPYIDDEPIPSFLVKNMNAKQKKLGLFLLEVFGNYSAAEILNFVHRDPAWRECEPYIGEKKTKNFMNMEKHYQEYAGKNKGAFRLFWKN